MEKSFNVALCGATKMAENLGAGWLTTRKAKKRQPLKEKNEGMQVSRIRSGSIIERRKCAGVESRHSSIIIVA